jgi:hypothetical protein
MIADYKDGADYTHICFRDDVRIANFYWQLSNISTIESWLRQYP